MITWTATSPAGVDPNAAENIFDEAAHANFRDFVHMARRMVVVVTERNTQGE